MVAESEKTGGGEAAFSAAMVGASSHHQSRRRRKHFNKPSWLLCTIADLDEKVKKVLTRKLPKENTSDSFAARANSYYHERPQLLALLHELYNGYLSLADRYCHVLAKNNLGCTLPVTYSQFKETNEDMGEVVDSDAESSVSFQPPMCVSQVESKETDVDMIVATLVMKTVECDLVMNELAGVEKRWGESSQKVELQRNLLDVLESERLILLNDNATLGYRVSVLVEENKGLASESLFLKREAAELARCVLKTTEDHRVFVLSRKIEDLQGQVYWLEKQNKEYYEQLVKQEETSKSCKGQEGANLEARGGLSKCFSFDMKRVDRQHVDGGGGVDGGRHSKLWDNLKKFNLFHRGAHFSSAGSCEKGKQNTNQSNLKMKQ